MKKTRKRMLILLITTVMILGVGYIGITYIAPYAIIVPLRVDPATKSTVIHPHQLALKHDTIDVQVADSVKYAGYWIHASDTAKKVVIVLHGISDVKESSLKLSQWLASEGISSVLIDLRAHGKSGGQFNTYGYYEKHDLSAIVKYIQQQDSSLKVGLWGNSLGGAIALQTLAIDKNIDFGIIQSTFSHLPQVISDYQKRYFQGLRIPVLNRYAMKRAGEIADFDPYTVHPAEAAKQISQSVYIFHGTADSNIDITYGRENFENISSPDKIFTSVEGGTHYDALAVGGEPLKGKILEFIKRQ